MPVSRREFVLASSLATAATGGAMAQNDKLQVGVIGCGARSQELMAALMSHPGVAIVGVADAYKGRVQRTQENWGPGAVAYAEYRELLARPGVDAVVIASPDHWHKQMCLDALAAGKDIYCEKPLTFRSAEGNELIAAAAKAKRILQVGSQGISGSLQQKAREIIRSGQIGKVTMIRAAYNRNTASGAWLYPIPPDASPQTVNWEQFQGPAQKHPFSLERFFRWRCYQDYSGGIATDLFVHLCTTIHYLMDAQAPAKAMALGGLYRWKESRDVPDTLSGLLEYPEGFAVNLSSTFNNQSAAEGSFHFLGTEGTLQLNYGSLQLMPESGVENNRWIVESWPKALESAYYRDPKVRATEVTDKTRPPAKKSAGATWRQEGSESTVLHFGHWLESIRTRKPFWEDAAAGHRAAACAHMINLSAREERVVKWDFQRNDVA